MPDNIDMFDYYQPRMLAQAREQQQVALFNTAFGAQPGQAQPGTGSGQWTGQAAGAAAFETQFIQQRLGSIIGGGMSQSGMPHFGTVKEFRNRFKEYTKAEFREMGNKPVIKEILSGMTKLNKEEIKDRIAEHLALV